MEKQTTINGYLVELDTDIDGEGTSSCMISKGRYCASLSAAESAGVLTDHHDDSEWPIHGRDIDKITDWAYANGY